MPCNCCKPVLFILLQSVHSGMCCTSKSPSEDFSTHIQRLQDKNSCDKQKKALFNLMWLMFESQSPTDNLWTPGFLWCVVCCEGTQNLWYLDYFLYIYIFPTLVLQMFLFSFLWTNWSHCSFPAVNAGRDLWSNVMIWHQENPLHYFYLLFVLNFLIKNTFSNYFLTVRISVCFLTPLYVQKYPTAVHMWVGFLTVLH